MMVSTLSHGDRTFCIDPPLDVCIEDFQDVLMAELPELGLVISGDNEEALLRDFAVVLSYAWDNYVCTDPETLTADASFLRNAIEARVNIR